MTTSQVDQLFERASSQGWDDQRLKKVVSQTTHSCCYEVKQPFDLVIDWRTLAPDSRPVVCEVTCPRELSLVKVPIKVELKGDIIENGQLATLKLEKPVEVCYEITNLCEDHIFECGSFLDVQSKIFYASGEIRASFDIMPLDTVTLKFAMLPLSLGLL